MSSSMAQISGLAAVASSSAMASNDDSRTAVGGFQGEDFMRLLIAQLQNQDPLNPLEPAEFMEQVAQLQTLAELVSIGDQVSELAGWQTALASVALLGREVTWVDEQGQRHQGTVGEVRQGSGQVQLVVGTELVEWGWVESVR